jgi:surface protein
MKKLLLLPLLLLPCTLLAQAPFITTWKTNNPGPSNNNQIMIPTAGGGYNYDVYWERVGDPTVNGSLTGLTGNVTITFPSVGTYRVEISGAFPHIYFNGGGDRQKILNIEQWGDIEWRSMQNAFRGCSNMTYNATDAPDLSMVTDLSGMFSDAVLFNGEIGNWDVSNVTTMGAPISWPYPLGGFGMFQGATSFNQYINDWDVSNVTNTTAMFGDASSFNQDLGAWDVCNVIIMAYMFANASSFNQGIGEWNVINVDDLSGLFSGAISFNQDIENWDVSGVSKMRAMFLNAASFNQNIGGWNVSNVSHMDFMFSGATSFNQDIGNWNVGNVSNLSSVFQDALSFNKDLSNWNVSDATNLSDMFRNAVSFNQNIGAWDVGNVSNLSGIFSGAILFDQPIGAWNVSNVTDMRSSFSGSSSFNQDIGEWDVSSVIYMGGWFSEEGMFSGATAFNQNLSNWDVSNVIDMGDMFQGAGLSPCNYESLLEGWSQLDLRPNVSFHGGSSRYGIGTPAEAARLSIIDNFGWTITDGGAVQHVSIAAEDISCHGLTDGNISIVAYGGQGDWDYSIDGGFNYQPQPTFNGLAAGSYAVQVWDADGGCGITGSAVIAEPDTLLLGLSATGAGCHGEATGSVSAIGSGGTGFLQYSINGQPYDWTGSFTALPVGNYTVSVMDGNACESSASIEVTQPTPLTAVQQVNHVQCRNGNDGAVTLAVDGGTATYQYEWEPPVGSGPAATGLPSGIYTTTVTDANGCTASQTVTVTEPEPLDVPLCLITVDSTSQYNIIVWEKPVSAEIDSFYVYREITQNNYQRIGAVPYEDDGRYHDFDANPNETSYRYRIAALDTCGVESSLSPFHNSIHLQSLGNGNLQWSLYAIAGQPNPVDFYRVYRDDNSNGNFLPISTTVPGGNSTYTDVNFSSYPNASYVVDVAWDLSCDPNRVLTTTRSNRYTGQFPVGVSGGGATDFTLFPNPASHMLTILLPENAPRTELVLRNMLGQDIHRSPVAAGRNELPLHGIAAGVYMVQVGNSTQRLIIAN